MDDSSNLSESNKSEAGQLAVPRKSKPVKKKVVRSGSRMNKNNGGSSDSEEASNDQIDDEMGSVQSSKRSSVQFKKADSDSGDYEDGSKS